MHLSSGGEGNTPLKKKTGEISVSIKNKRKYKDKAKEEELKLTNVFRT